MATDASTALLFPGQGSQSPGMREMVEAACPELLELAVERTGDDPFDRLQDGTRFAQPALFCASLAAWTRAGRPRADCLAGHSLGEFAALVAAGSLPAEDGMRLVALRGRLMQEAAEIEPGGMMALRAGRADARAIAAPLGLTVANDNAPDQVVLSGPDAALEAAAAQARARGVRALRLPVRGAFHSPAMRRVVPRFRAALAGVEFAAARAPVYSSVTARPFDDPRTRLAQALVRPVRWRSTLYALRRAGVERFVEAGPGHVLSGLVARTLDGVAAITLEHLEPARA